MKLIKILLIAVTAMASLTAPAFAIENVAVGEFEFVDRSGKTDMSVSAWNSINEREFSFLLAEVLSSSSGFHIVESPLHANFIVSGKITKLNRTGDATITVFLQAANIVNAAGNAAQGQPRIDVGSSKVHIDSAPDAIIALVGDALALAIAGLQQVETSKDAVAMP